MPFRHASSLSINMDKGAIITNSIKKISEKIAVNAVSTASMNFICFLWLLNVGLEGLEPATRRL